MRQLLKLAVRNVLRNRRRTLFTMVAIFIAVALFVIARGLVGGIENTMVGMEIDTEHSHLRVMTKKWLEEADYFPLEHAIEDGTKIRDLIESEYKGARVAYRTAFVAKIGDGERSLACRGLLIDPSEYLELFKLSELRKANSAVRQ